MPSTKVASANVSGAGDIWQALVAGYVGDVQVSLGNDRVGLARFSQKCDNKDRQ